MWLLYILETALFTYISFLLGKLILKAVKWRSEAVLHSVLATTIGYGSIALIGLILALFGILNQFWLYVIGLIILVISYKTIIFHAITWTSASHWRNTIHSWWQSLKSEPVPFILMSLWVIAYILIALSPTSMGKDGLAYHLPFAVEISQSQHISFPVMADPEYGQLPLIGEVLYAVTISLFNNIAVMKLLQFVGLFLLIIGGIALLRENVTSRRLMYVVLALLLACMPLARNALSGAMIDIWAFLFGLLSIFLIANVITNKSSEREFKSGLIVSGILIGLALGVKYLALFMATIGLVEIVLISTLNKTSTRAILKACAMFVVPAVIVGGFWYIKNLILTGNPFFPIFSTGGGAEFTAEVNAFVLDRTWYNFLMFPFFIFGKSTYHLPFGIFTALTFAVTYISFIFLAIKKRLHLVYMALFIALELYLGFVFIWSHQIRFIIPALVMNSFIAIIGLSHIISHYRTHGSHSFGTTSMPWSKYCTAPILSLFVLALLIASAVSFKQELACLSSDQVPSCYARVEGGAYYATEYINEHFHNIRVIEYFNVFYRYSMRKGNIMNNFFCTEKTDLAVQACLESARTLYYLDDTKSRQDPWIRDKAEKLRTAEYFVKNGQILFEYYDPSRDTYIRLYSIK